MEKMASDGPTWGGEDFLADILGRMDYNFYMFFLFVIFWIFRSMEKMASDGPK